MFAVNYIALFCPFHLDYVAGCPTKGSAGLEEGKAGSFLHFSGSLLWEQRSEPCRENREV